MTWNIVKRNLFGVHVGFISVFGFPFIESILVQIFEFGLFVEKLKKYFGYNLYKIIYKINVPPFLVEAPWPSVQSLKASTPCLGFDFKRKHNFLQIIG